METLNQVTTTIALTMDVAWESGINLYATLLMLGYLADTGTITLPPDLRILGNPLVIAAAGFMYCVEFFVDKMPGVDTGWDAIHSFIRISAGALFAAGAVGDVTPAVHLAAAILGGGLAAGAHASKAGSRVLGQRLAGTDHQLDGIHQRGHRRVCRPVGLSLLSVAVPGVARPVYRSDDLAVAEDLVGGEENLSFYWRSLCQEGRSTR